MSIDTKEKLLQDIALSLRGINNNLAEIVRTLGMDRNDQPSIRAILEQIEKNL